MGAGKQLRIIWQGYIAISSEIIQTMFCNCFALVGKTFSTINFTIKQIIGYRNTPKHMHYMIENDNIHMFFI